MAQNNTVFKEAGETLYKLNQDDELRYLCEMREEGKRILRTYQSLIRQGGSQACRKRYRACRERRETRRERNCTCRTRRRNCSASRPAKSAAKISASWKGVFT